MKQIIYSRFEFPIELNEGIDLFRNLYSSNQNVFDGRIQVGGFSGCIRISPERAAIILTYDEYSHTIMKIKLSNKKGLQIKLIENTKEENV